MSTRRAAITLRSKGLKANLERCLQVAAVTVLAVAALYTVGTAASAEARKPPSGESQSQPDAEPVLLWANVMDDDGNPVSNLQHDNFRVYEDKVEQTLSVYRREDLPISIGVILDVSGSMTKKLERSRTAVAQFLSAANPADEFFLITFNDHAQLVVPFTTRKVDIDTRLMSAVAYGRTALLDAIYLGLSQMREAHNPRKALLLITDGGDNHSRYTGDEILNFAREADTQIYAIDLHDPVGSRATPEEVNGPELISQTAQLAGGHSFAVANLNNMPGIAAKIGQAMRNQYVLGYLPTNRLRGGNWRKIKVKLRPPKGLPPLNVYAKSGYYSPQ